MSLPIRIRSLVNSALRQIWPRLLRESDLNPPELFEAYGQACARVSRRSHEQIASQLLDLAQYLFQEEESRRIRLEGTASNLLNIQGVVAAVVIALIGLLVIKEIPVSGGLLLSIVVIYGVSLVYISTAFLFCLSVFLHEPRYYPDPTDLVPEESQERPLYELEVGRRLMEYTVANYRVNNRQVNRIRVARAMFRNAILSLLTAGILLGVLIAWKGCLGSS